MMKQYLETKAQVGDALLFFRLGDFYELFFEDAAKAAELLKITLTARSKGDNKVPMAGVPYHSARRYIARLVAQGFKVAICDQVEEAVGQALVKREVVRIVTPGTVLDDDVLEGTQASFFAAFEAQDDGSVAAAVLDATTGEFHALRAAPLDAIADELNTLEVRELIHPPGQEHAVEQLCARLGKTLPATALEADAFDRKRAKALLFNHLKVKSLEGFGLPDDDPCVAPAGAALRYLSQTQKVAAAHVDRLSVLSRGKCLVLDEASKNNLELLKNLQDGGRAGSLLWALDRTATVLGARKLSRWLSAPLAETSAIAARLDAVEALLSKASVREALHAHLKGVADLERLTARLALKAGNPRDLGALGRSLKALPSLEQALEPLAKASKGPLLSSLLSPWRDEQLLSLSKTLEKALLEELPATVADGGFIREGFDEELDGFARLAKSGKDYLAQLETREKERTGIASLKVRYNRVFGYYLEVTKANLHLVPKSWVRKQTTVGGERYVTDELREYEDKVLTADSKRLAKEQKLFELLREQTVALAGPLKAAAGAVATLDVLCSFATVAAERRYVRPVIDESDALELVAARHPVVELSLKHESFIPNEVKLDRKDRQLLVITGPNMAGKSTVMRQTALAVVMAQAGSYVPAKEARVGLCDRVFTRVGASDNLAKGHSTFMVEMTETANILHHASRRSLVVLDEIGRGTSTFDGLSIAWAVAEHLHDRIGCRTLFATHYHELTELSKEKPKVKNCSIAVKEQPHGVLFLRKLVEGAASKSYGIEVAALAGLPPEVLARSRELLKNLESNELDESGHARLAAKARGELNVERPAEVVADDPAQLGLFGGEPPKRGAGGLPSAVSEALAKFPLDSSTPLDALNAIARWKRGLP
ncbi:MAG: DNA mismatch repair protein MutS [Myxococcaceae bacterium]